MRSETRLSQVLKKFDYSDKRKNSDQLEFGENNEFTVEIANDIETRIQAYRLLYKTYVEKEFAKPHSSKMWYSIFDAHPDTATIVVKEGDKVRGALTIVIDSSMGLPADSLYLEELNLMRIKGDLVSEIISLGIDSDARGGTEILEKLFNFSYLYAKGIFGASKFIITVNPRHAVFYEKKLLFQRVGFVKDYDRVGGMPAICLELDLIMLTTLLETPDRISELKRTIYSNFINVKESKKVLHAIGSCIVKMKHTELQYFFVNQRSLFKLSPKWMLDALKSYYCHLNFDQLFVDDQLEIMAIC
ncbi:MAG: hypothetical protein COA79_07455 [Planctomycetota bacterium]|nr:MAG: hypothetical protein COA79_07455 [Planctomycetota bacterium]